MVTTYSLGLSTLGIGLGWDPNSGSGDPYNLNLSVLMLDIQGRLMSANHVVTGGHTASPDGSFSHSGDNATGQGTGDDETIVGQVYNVDTNVHRILIFVNSESGESFGNIDNAYVRLYNVSSSAEFSRYNLTNDFGSSTGLKAVLMTRYNFGWKFNFIEEEFNGDLDALIASLPQ